MIASPGQKYPHFKAVIYTNMEADDETCFCSEVLISLRLMLAQLRKVRLMHHKIVPVIIDSFLSSILYYFSRLLTKYSIGSTCLVDGEACTCIGVLF